MSGFFFIEDKERKLGDIKNGRYKFNTDKYLAQIKKDYEIQDLIIIKKTGQPEISSKSQCKFKYISIAHCQNNIVYSLSETPIGIDIECIKSPEIFSSIFSENERALVYQDASTGFIYTLIWTIKESFLKL